MLDERSQRVVTPRGVRNKELDVKIDTCLALTPLSSNFLSASLGKDSAKENYPSLYAKECRYREALIQEIGGTR